MANNMMWCGIVDKYSRCQKCKRCLAARRLESRRANAAAGTVSKWTAQRRAAKAAKAAASGGTYTPRGGTHRRTASSSGGYTPRAARTPTFTQPKMDPRGLAIAALSALEDAVVAKMALGDVTDDMERSYSHFKKATAMALSVTDRSTPEDCNQADAALRFATITMVKLLF